MREIKTPEQCVRSVMTRLSSADKMAFASAIVIGLLAHLYAFTNKLYNYDELYNTPGNYGVGIENNRWFLELLGRFSSRTLTGSYSFPWVNGAVSILLLAISAMLVVRMFEVKSTLFAGVIGGFMVAFPAVTCMFFFMFTAVYYSVGIFLSILAAYFLVRLPKNIFANLLAVLSLACSLGIYQAYFPNAVCLCLLAVILSCAFEGKERKLSVVVLRGVHYVLALVAGMGLYFILNKVFQRVWATGGSMGSYQGMDTMGQITAGEFIDGIKLCYQSFFALGREGMLYLNPTQFVVKAFLIIMLVLVGSALFLLYVYKEDWKKKALMLLGIALFPVAMFLIYIMAPKAYVYTLVIYPAVFILIFFVVWVDRYSQVMERYGLLTSIMQWIAVVLSGIILVAYIWYANGCYMCMEYTKYHDMAYFETMVTQIKSLDGYTDEMQVVFIGDEIEDESHQMGGLIDKVFAMEGKSETHINSYSRWHLVTKYLGYAPEFGGYEEVQKWMANEEVQEMSCYPDDGSIKIIDDTIIVKLSEIE